MIRSLLIFYVVFPISLVFAQQSPNQTWYFGKYGGLKFTNAVPSAITGKLDTWEGCAVYSDPTTGNVLLYSDGKKVYLPDGSILSGGDSLKSGISSTQCCIFIPDPANAKRVYLFTAPDLTGPGSNHSKSYYSHISLENTPTMLIANVELQDNMSEKIAGTQFCGDNSYWVLYHHKSQSRIYAYKVTSAGVSMNPVISNYANQYNYYNVGALKVSPDGSKLVMCSEANLENYLQAIVLFDFNIQTGQASNPKFIAKKKCYGNYGAAFSPDSKKLFTTGTLDRIWNSESALFQFDITLTDENSIANSMWTLPMKSKKLYGMQLGPDGKIYVIVDNPNQLDVITKPNKLASEIDYSTNVVNQGGKVVLGLPSQIEYGLGLSIDSVLACPSSGIRIGSPPMPGYTYAWSPSIGLSNASISNPNAKPTVPTTYTLFITNPFGCQTKQTFHVGLLPSVNVKIEKPSGICKGGKAQLKASGASTYKWYPAYGLSSTTIPNPIASPDSTMQYFLIASNGICTDTVSVRVDVVPFPEANAGKDKTTCPGGSVEIGENPKSGYTYLWSPEQYVSNKFLSKTIATPPTPNFRYILKVTSEYGCVAFDTVIVNTENNLTALTSPDTTICRGDQIQLRASGGSVFRWFMGPNISDTTSSTPIVRPDNNTTYGVIVSSGQCIDTAFIRVNVIQGVLANAGNDKSTCPNESIQLGSTQENGAQYSWEPSTFLDNSQSSNPSCTPSSSIDYILTVISGAGCVSYDTIRVTVADVLNISLVDDTSTCPGKPITLKPTGAQTYRWSPGIGINDTTASEPIFTPVTTTTYYVEAKNGNCIGYDSVTIRVLPLPNVDAGNDIAICPGDTITLKPTGAMAYRWTERITGFTSNQEEIQVIPMQSTMYYVEGTNAGCSVIDSILITVKPQPIITVIGDTVTCLGNEISLSAQGGDTYEWLDHKSIIAKNGNVLIAKPDQNTYYAFRGVKDGCSSSLDSILVSVNATLPIIQSADTITCANSPISVKIFPSSDIVITGNCTLLSNASDSLIIMPNASGFIHLNGIRSGCPSKDSFYVEVKDVPTVTLPRDTTLCRGSSLEIESSGANLYTWSSDEVFTQINEQTIRFDSITSQIFVKVIGNNGFCDNSDEMQVNVIDPFTATFSLQTDATMTPGERFFMNVNIPTSYANARLAISYDPTASIIEQHVSPAGINAQHISTTPGEYQLEINNPNRVSGSISLSLMPYLPPDSRSANTYELRLLEGEEQCVIPELSGCEVQYDKACAWTIRSVSLKSQYQFFVKDNAIHIQAGLNDHLHCIFSTIDGRILLEDECKMQAGEQKRIPLPKSLPFGTYAITIQGAVWKETMLYPHYGENQ
jgi:hypothetical protein